MRTCKLVECALIAHMGPYLYDNAHIVLCSCPLNLQQLPPRLYFLNIQLRCYAYNTARNTATVVTPLRQLDSGVAMGGPWRGQGLFIVFPILFVYPIQGRIRLFDILWFYGFGLAPNTFYKFYYPVPIPRKLFLALADERS